MPLANVGCAVAGAAEERGDSDFAGAKVHGRAVGDPVADADAGRCAAGHERGARWRTVGVAGIAAGEAESFSREAVEIWGLDVAAAVAGEVAVAEVVVEDEDDVGARWRLLSGAVVECGEQNRGN